MVFDQKALGTRIRNLRNERQLTQEQLAEIMNISAMHLRNIESGRKSGSIDLICDFSEYFEVSTDYLLKGKDTAGRTAIRQELLAEMEKLSALVRQL